MAKLTLTNVASGYNRQAIDDNFDAIVQELQNKVLYRDNPVGEPNHLETDIDMNGKNILNAGNVDVSTITLDGQFLGSITFEGNYYVGSVEPVATAGDLWYNTVTTELNYYNDTAFISFDDQIALAVSSASDSATSAATALTYQTGAQAAQTAAETAQGLAETAQTGAETAQGLAETAQAAAETAQASAETAETNAEAVYDTFRSAWYGPLASDPVLDPLGNPITDGDVYFNTTLGNLFVYNSGSWEAGAFTGTDAVGVTYDNTSSGLTANNVQAAIDEIDTVLDTIDPSITNGSFDPDTLGTASLQSYSEQNVTLNTGSFVGNTAQLKFTRVGRMVTMSTTAQLTHSSSAFPSASGVVPAEFRPSSQVRNIFHTGTAGGLLTAFSVEITASGNITLYYQESDGTTVARVNSSVPVSIAYTI